MSKSKTALVIIAFLIWLTLPLSMSVVQQEDIDTNRRGIECIIQQLSEHRMNNRSAHLADADSHDYDYDVPEMAIPDEVSIIGHNVCNEWLKEK